MALFRPIKLQLNGVRLSYPHLFNKQSVSYQGKIVREEYSAEFLISKKDQKEELSTLFAKVEEACKALELPININYPNQAKNLDILLSKYIPRIKDGDKYSEEKAIEGKDYKYLEGYYKISANNQKKAPIVLDKENRILLPDNQIVYSGCYVDAALQLSPVEIEGKKRILIGLIGVRFNRDGEPFGNKSYEITDYWQPQPAANTANESWNNLTATDLDDEIPF